MKTPKTLVLLLALVPALGRAQTAADYVAQGRAFLGAHDLLNAKKRFASAVALAPKNPDANVLLASTRLLTLANQPAGEAFLDRLGFAATNRSVYGWTANVPRDTNGVPFAPAGVSAAEIPAFLLTNCLPEIIAADANLAVVSDTNYTLALSSNETSTVSVTLDYGDLLLLRAGLNAAEYACYTVCPWDFDVQLAELRSFLTNGASTAEEFLEQYPSLLTFTTTDDLQAARQAFSSAVALYTNASAFIHNRPLSTIRLFNYDPISDQSEAKFRTILTELNDSLSGPVVLKSGTNITIDMGNSLASTFAPRAFLPQFSGNAIVAGTLPDPTFGGVVQGFEYYQIEDFLGNKRHMPFVSRLTIPHRLAAGQFGVVLGGLENSLYAIQTSTNLHDWTDLAFGVVHAGVLSFPDPSADGGPRRFYRALDSSGSVGVALTVIDAQTGNPVSAATVTLSVGWWGWNGGSNVWHTDNAVTNYTDGAGHTTAVLDPMGDSSYMLTVAASSYAAWSFDGYLPGDQHRSLSASLAPPGYDPPNDNFAQRQMLTGTNLSATGCNVGATSQPNEPYPGVGQTVWWTWTAPSDGVVTVDTSGSSFNAVLGIYSGNKLANLTPVASTDTAFGSQASFFVTAGVSYQICVDSSDGSSGRILLTLHYTAPQPPVFTLEPGSQAVQAGSYIELDGLASGTAPVSYQWQKDGNVIAGATDTYYSPSWGAQTSDAGSYTLMAINAAGISTSAPAVLTVIAPPPNDMFANATVITGTNSIVYGYDWSATSEAGEPSLGTGQSVWWTWTAPMDGVAVVDIRGSTGGQVLGAYTGNSVSNLTAVEEFADVADFFVQAGTSYQIEVDSADSGGRIVLRLYYTTPSAPVFDTQPASLTVALGQSAYFYAHATGPVPLSYQWRQNGVDLIGQTDPALFISDVQTNQTGAYTVVATNAAGSATSAPALLTVTIPPIFTTLYDFTGGSDGGGPEAGLILSGNTLYGTAYQGGNGLWGNGTVFKVNTDGTDFTNLHDFTASYINALGYYTNSDGAGPGAGLILASSTLYGTAQGGGGYGNGTVFAVNTEGTGFKNLHTFTAGYTNSSGYYVNSDGADPCATLILAGDTLYGTAQYGGNSGSGTVFAVNTNGTTFTTLYSFSATDTNGVNSDGAHPFAGLILSGNTLYGTANGGGQSGNGTVFAVNTNGTGFITLHSFSATDTNGVNNDGAVPYCGLVLSSNTLYGTAYGGGSSGWGTVFALNTNGTGFMNLHSFTDGTDGGEPVAGLILSGNTLYGTAQYGGDSGQGAVFSLDTNGAGYTTLYSFSARAYDSPIQAYVNSDGADLQAGLILSGNTLYGMAAEGGNSGWGTVFSLTLPAAASAP